MPMIMTRGKKAIRPPAPPACAINDKFSGEAKKDIAAAPSSRCDIYFGEVPRTKPGSAPFNFRTGQNHEVRSEVPAGFSPCLRHLVLRHNPARRPNFPTENPQTEVCA